MHKFFQFYIEVSTSTVEILEEIIFQREMIDIFHHRTIATPGRTHLDIGEEWVFKKLTNLLAIGQLGICGLAWKLSVRKEKNQKSADVFLKTF